MAKQTPLYHSRKFLNPKTGTASIEIITTSKTPESYSSEISISDCNRKVVIDMYTYKGNRKERLSKLNLLISELTKYRDSYEKDTEFLK